MNTRSPAASRRIARTAWGFVTPSQTVCLSLFQVADRIRGRLGFGQVIVERHLLGIVTSKDGMSLSDSSDPAA